MTPFDQRGAILVALEPFALLGDQAEHVAYLTVMEQHSVQDALLGYTRLRGLRYVEAIKAIEHALVEPVRQEAS